jgi:hypothetical protein
MKRFRKYSLQIAAAAILAVVLTLAAPRALHAVTAALVTVTNNSSNPVVAQSVNQLTSQNVMLQAFHQALTDGTVSHATFVVPFGQSFVVTGIDILPAAASSAGPSTGSVGNYSSEIVNGVSHNVRMQLVEPCSCTKHYEYSSGLVFTAGGSVEMHNDLSSPSGVQMYIFGYLTSN